MKHQIYTIFAVLIAQFSGLFAPKPIVFSDDNPFIFNLGQPSLKILQFTDLHLTYGFDANDQKTLSQIEKITLHEAPDLIVLTGDQTLSISAPARYRQLIRHMETLKTPWTMIFGNHENDFHSFNKIIATIESEETDYLYFKLGPALTDGGYGNFHFNYYYNDNPFYHFYFLDSKTELKRQREITDLSRYEYFSTAQVDWFKDKVALDKLAGTESAVFTHIPLVQYRYAEEAVGTPALVGHIREGIYTQSRDTGFFNAMKESGVSKAVFVGHDHRNNFEFDYEGIKLVYGQNSGYNGYGNITRGARIITIDSQKTLSTYIIYEDLTYDD